MSVYHLEKVFKPRSVAVIGASERKGSVGWAIMKNILDGQFPGKVVPVNPGHQTLWNLPAYADISQLHEPVDLAVIAVPIRLVPAVIRQCGDIGIMAAIIISAGGKETGLEGRKLEEAIHEEAGSFGIRIIGPNCLGVISSHVKLNASFASQMPLAGKMAFISQSGAICTVILDLSITERIGFSYFVSLGSMMDVDFGDVIDYLGGDPNVSSIVMYVENLTRIRNFMSAARSVSMIKPIVVLKAGRSHAGARAAASHTGALAGEDAVYDTAFKRAGIVRVITFEELFDCAELLAKRPKPTGAGLGIVTNAGGLGVMAADALADHGAEPVALRSETLEKLNRILSANWSRQNPIDMVGDSSADQFVNVVEVCSQASEMNALLVMLAPQAMIDPAEVARRLVKIIKQNSLPIITAWMGGERVEKGREIFNQAGIPTFDTAERAVRSFMDLYHHGRNIEMLREIPSKLPRKLAFDTQSAGELIQQRLSEGNGLLTEAESKELLKAYGIPVNPTEVALTAEDAVAAAGRVGFPVAVKLLSQDITHKSDAGGVRLDLQNPSEVRKAFQDIMTRARDYAPEASIMGVSVQAMISDCDYEIIVGIKQDRDFGPVLLFGMGGIATEIVKDRALALPPLNRLLARRMMEETKMHALLRGYRSRPPVNMEMLEEILCRLSQLAVDFPEIAELDINPLMVKAASLWAADARVVLKKSSVTSPHHLVISPYPAQYQTRVVTKGAVEVVIRPIKPDDAVLLENLFKTLSSRSIYYRFFRPLKTLPHYMLARFTQIDYDREIALVAISESNDGETMLGVARVILEWNQRDAEFSVLVGDPWQGKGIGAELLKRCLSMAKERNYATVHGAVLSENTHMLRLGRKMGFTIQRVPDAGEFELTLDLHKTDLRDVGLWSPN
jgi:acetyltransferase